MFQELNFRFTMNQLSIETKLFYYKLAQLVLALMYEKFE